MSRPDAILFDLDGTLTDPREELQEAGAQELLAGPAQIPGTVLRKTPRS